MVPDNPTISCCGGADAYYAATLPTKVRMADPRLVWTDRHERTGKQLFGRQIPRCAGALSSTGSSQMERQGTLIASSGAAALGMKLCGAPRTTAEMTAKNKATMPIARIRIPLNIKFKPRQ
jgi:hypothetical protein